MRDLDPKRLHARRAVAEWRAIAERLRETGSALLHKLDVDFDLDDPEYAELTDAFEEAILVYDRKVLLGRE